MSAADDTGKRPSPRARAVCQGSLRRFMMAKNFVLDGQGFLDALFPIVAKDFHKGRLVRVLPKLSLRTLEVFADYPVNAPKDGLARNCVNFLREQLWVTDYGWTLPESPHGEHV